MHREPRTIDVGNVLAEVAEEFGELVRHGVADRIGDVHRRRTGIDHGLDHLGEELEFRARGVLRRELDIVTELTGDPHPLHCIAQDLFLGHVELVLAMDGAGGEEDMDAVFISIAQRSRGFLDVVPVAAREAADDGALDLARNRVDGRPVARRGGRKTGLDHVHAEVG